MCQLPFPLLSVQTKEKKTGNIRRISANYLFLFWVFRLLYPVIFPENCGECQLPFPLLSVQTNLSKLSGLYILCVPITFSSFECSDIVRRMVAFTRLGANYLFLFWVFRLSTRFPKRTIRRVPITFSSFECSDQGRMAKSKLSRQCQLPFPLLSVQTRENCWF